MKSGPRMAVAVGIGYILGRTRKMKLALMIAGASATGRLGEAPRRLLQQGYKKLAASPEFGKVRDSVRGELLTAAKTAAMTAATSRIESLSSRIQQGAGVPGTRRRGEEREEPGEARADEDDAGELHEHDGQADHDDEHSDEEPRASRRPRAATNDPSPARGSERSAARRVRR